MTISNRRRDRPCLSPIRLTDVVDDPEGIRELCSRNGPYRFPERPGGFIWPTWHAPWATNHQLLLEAASPLLHHEGFMNAAAQMSGADHIVPEGVYVNLGTPWIAQPVMHTDLPLFRGIDKDAVPGWFLQSMGTSWLFEAERIDSITAVAWFFAGENGGFTCWPDGPSGDRLEQTDMWNNAIVGDNAFMYHRVEQIGREGATSPHAMTASSTLDHDGDDWVVADDAHVLGRFDDHDVRLSVSWTATVYDSSDAATSLEDAYDRIAHHIGPDFAATGVDDLFGEPARVQLMERWPGFLPV